MPTLMSNFVMIPFAVVLLIAGVVVTPLPIPFGVPMILAALTILIARSDRVARWFSRLRARYGRLNRWVSFMEAQAPEAMAATLRRTRPGGPPHRK